jgi:hypothetical protein
VSTSALGAKRQECRWTRAPPWRRVGAFGQAEVAGGGRAANSGAKYGGACIGQAPLGFVRPIRAGATKTPRVRFRKTAPRRLGAPGSFGQIARPQRVTFGFVRPVWRPAHEAPWVRLVKTVPSGASVLGSFGQIAPALRVVWPRRRPTAPSAWVRSDKLRGGSMHPSGSFGRSGTVQETVATAFEAPGLTPLGKAASKRRIASLRRYRARRS